MTAADAALGISGCAKESNTASEGKTPRNTAEIVNAKAVRTQSTHRGDFFEPARIE